MKPAKQTHNKMAGACVQYTGDLVQIAEPPRPFWAVIRASVFLAQQMDCAEEPRANPGVIVGGRGCAPRGRLR